MSEPSEEWRPITGWPEYEVSNLGRVKRVAPGARTRAGRILAMGGKATYAHVSLSAKTRLPPPGWRSCLVHSLVAEAFHGPRPTPGHEVAHIDGRHRNNAATNLRWATAQENQLDRLKHGTACQGEAHPLARLTAAQVLEIRRRLGEASFNELGRQYGVSGVLISKIAKRRTWKHV